MKKFIITVLIIFVGFTGWYIYNYLDNASVMYNKGVTALHKNHYYTARLAFNYILKEYPYSPLSDDAEKYLGDIETILKRYFVFYASSLNINNLVEYQSKLKIKNLDSKIIKAENFSNFRNNEYILMINRFEKLKDAESTADSLNNLGIKVFVRKAY